MIASRVRQVSRLVNVCQVVATVANPRTFFWELGDNSVKELREGVWQLGCDGFDRWSIYSYINA